MPGMKLRAIYAIPAVVLLLVWLPLSLLGCDGGEVIQTETVAQATVGAQSVVSTSTSGAGSEVASGAAEISSHAEAEVDIETETETDLAARGSPAEETRSQPSDGEVSTGPDDIPGDTGTNEDIAEDFGIYVSFVSPNPVVNGTVLEADVVISGTADTVTVELRQGQETMYEYPLTMRTNSNGHETWRWVGTAPDAVSGGYDVYISAHGTAGKNEVEFHGTLQVEEPAA
jgi:hypothetical protein